MKITLTDTISGKELTVLTEREAFRYPCLGEDAYIYHIYPKQELIYLRHEPIVLMDDEQDVFLTKTLDGQGEHIKADNFNQELFDLANELMDYEICLAEELGANPFF